MPNPTELPMARVRAVGAPLLLELSVGIGMGVVGTALAARLSDNNGAAFALANHVMAMLFILFRVVGAGVGVVITQQLGGGAHELARRTGLTALAAAGWIGFIISAFTFGFAVPLVGLMNAPNAVMPLAVQLLQAFAILVILDAWNATFSSLLRAHLLNRQALVIVLITSGLQLVLAPLFMFGLQIETIAIHVPKFGLIGFALAAGISRVCALLLNLAIAKKQLKLASKPLDWVRLQAEPLRAILHIGLPAAAENIAYRLCFTVTVSVAGLLGAQSLSAQAYVLQLTYIALMFGLALGFAVEVVVGHLVGAGSLAQAHHLVKRTLLIGLIVSVPATCVAALLAPWTLKLFTQDEHIIALGVTLMWCTVLLEPGRTFNLIVINALRATGDASYPAAAGTGSMIIVLAIGSYILAVPLGMGLVGVWVAYGADEWLRGLMMWRRWISLAWVPHAKQAHRKARDSLRVIQSY